MGAWQVIASQDLVCVCVCVRVFILISFSLYLCTSACVSARSMLGCACERALFSPALPVKPPSPALPFPPSVPFLPSLCLFYIHHPPPPPPLQSLFVTAFVTCGCLCPTMHCNLPAAPLAAGGTAVTSTERGEAR